MLKLSNINFAFDTAPIIDRLSLNVERGAWLGVIGPNGAGKTTLLKLISGVLRPIDGEINIDDRAIQKFSRNEMARLIAVVPQVSSFTFPFTVSEIVLMGRAPYLKNFGFETAMDIAIAEEAMKRTDIWQFRSRSIDELSGGERQRVLIARALAQEPKILLLDEPTTFLDIKHQLDIMEILTELNKDPGLTIISAIHDVNLAISYCKTIALLNNGRIFKLGTPAEVVTYSNLKEVFSADVYVGLNEFTGNPYYVPMKKQVHPST